MPLAVQAPKIQVLHVRGERLGLCRLKLREMLLPQVADPFVPIKQVCI